MSLNIKFKNRYLEILIEYGTFFLHYKKDIICMVTFFKKEQRF